MPESEVIDLTGLSESESEEEEEEEHYDESGEQSSSDDDAEVPVDADSRLQLYEAIENLGEDRLKRVLIDLVSIPVVEERLTRQLLTLKRKMHDVVSRWETCGNCGEEFDMASRRESDEECSFHPGELEVDESGFVDWDEDCHGPMDSSDNRRQYPENFKWTCCEQDGRAEGCVHGVHRQVLSKKRRL